MKPSYKAISSDNLTKKLNNECHNIIYKPFL